MKVELLGALDSSKLKKLLKEQINEVNIEDKTNIELFISEIENLEKIELEQRVSIVAAAARLSRFSGNVFEILGLSSEKSLKQNIDFIKRVIKMGHDSTTDHDYLVFAIQDVSPVIEQTIIGERFSSFTIKSRREVDFSNVGFYTPNFRNEKGQILANNDLIKQEFQQYINQLFQKYNTFVNKEISKEDARFVLPYCYHSNIIMGIDAHTLKDMIIKFRKTKYDNIQELKMFGDILYEIACQKVPYIIDEIDKIEPNFEDEVDTYLNQKIKDRKYEILTGPKLLNSTNNIDDTILIASIMRRYQYSYAHALKVYQELCKNTPNFKEQLMRKIAFSSDQLELTQVNFEFQIPLSFAVLTHLTRHRTHNILVPDFAPVVDLMQYKIPPKIKATCLSEFNDVFVKNMEMYNHFKKDYGICEEDLIYFTLSGNMVNVISNMNGKTLKHILGLRECTKAQWETRQMAIGMHTEVDKLPTASMFSSILGATCTTEGFCKEGKESCGRILTLQKNKDEHYN